MGQLSIKEYVDKLLTENAELKKRVRELESFFRLPRNMDDKNTSWTINFKFLQKIEQELIEEPLASLKQIEDVLMALYAVFMKNGVDILTPPAQGEKGGEE